MDSPNSLSDSLLPLESSPSVATVLSLSPLIRRNTALEKLNREGSSSFLQAVFNGVNVLAGIGILSLPYSMMEAGWAAGLCLLVYFCIITNYTGKLIGKCMAQGDRNIKSFQDLGLESFGVRGQVFISVVLSLELVGALTMYLVMMGDNLHKVFPSVDRNAMCFISALVVLPTCWTTRLNLLSNLSVVGIMATILLVVALVETGLTLPEDEPYGSFESIDLSEFCPFNNQIQYSIGIIMAGFAGHTVFPSIYMSLQDKSHFSSLINVVYVFCFILYVMMAMLGYLLFRDQTQEEVTLNLYDVAGNTISVKITMWLIIINPFTKFGLTLNPLAMLVESLLGIKTADGDASEDAISWREWTKSLLVRTSLLLLTLTLAVVLPSFAFVCSLLGAFCSFIVSAIFPICCYLKLFPDISRCLRFVNTGLVMFNCCLCAVGTVVVFIR